MRKILFICKNVDLRLPDEIAIGEKLEKDGHKVLVYETDVKPNNDIESILSEHDLVIISTDNKNGFEPKIIDGDYKQIVFTIGFPK